MGNFKNNKLSMKSWFHKSEEDLSSEDLQRLADLANQVADAWEILEQQRQLLTATVSAMAPSVLTSYENWRAIAAQWAELASRFHLKEAKALLNQIEETDSDLSYLKQLAKA